MQLTSISWLGWSLLSAVFAAATAILAKLGVEKIDSNLATAIRTSVVVLFAWLMVLITRPDAPYATISRRSWLFLVLSGLGTGLSWLCYFRALKMGPASRVAPIDKLSVALVILASALFLGERLTWAKGAGGLLIVAGAIIIALE
jgi:bacterial/archaeal transporter family protein